jgi:hydroxypyruvate isomerase
MTMIELKALCALLMSDDPTSLNPGQREVLEDFANREARKHGFDGWIDCYMEPNK